MAERERVRERARKRVLLDFLVFNQVSRAACATAERLSASPLKLYWPIPRFLLLFYLRKITVCWSLQYISMGCGWSLAKGQLFNSLCLSFLISFFFLCRELDHNDISGTIEDTNGAFTGLENLNKLWVSHVLLYHFSFFNFGPGATKTSDIPKILL